MSASGSDLRDRADSVKTGAAIDRPIQPRQERYERRGSALGAGDLVKLAWGLALSLAASIGSALVAALRLVQQTSFGEEGLLAG
jgi:hypothetical protein